MKAILSILIGFIYLTIIENNIVGVNGCLYHNPITGDIYDFSTLKKPTNSYYSANFPHSLTKALIDFSTWFNFCNGTISDCNGGPYITACQSIGFGSTSHYIMGSTTVPEEVIYNGETGMTIVYRSPNFTKEIGNDCSGALEPNRRKTYLEFLCFPEIDYMASDGEETSLCTYKLLILSKFVCRQCSTGCSDHGACDPDVGCVCDSQTTGKRCEISKIYIGSVNSTTIDGGLTQLNGFFGNTSATRLSIYIGPQKCNNISVISDSEIQCYIGAGTGIYDVNITDHDLSHTAIKAFQYLPNQSRCPDDCGGVSNGKCNIKTGTCDCLDNYTGFNCKSIIDPEIPITKPIINETTGETLINNEDSNYQISIYSLVELGFNGSLVNEFILHDKWNFSTKSNTSSSSIFSFSQFIASVNCTIQYSIEEVIGNKKNYSFAGVFFSLQPGSIKLTVSVLNYEYSSVLNTIQLRIKSLTGKSFISNTNKDCNKQDLEINTSDFNNNQEFNYLTISKNSKTFYGRFINKVLSDGRPTFSTTNIIHKDDKQILIGLNLPHCKEKCLIDPDFSLLVSQEYKKTCDIDSRPKWFLPVVIAAPIVGAALLIIVGALLYKRHRVGIKILKQKIQLDKINK